VSDGPGGSVCDGDARLVSGESIDELLGRAVAAINRGDRASVSALAARVLAVDRANPDAEVLFTDEAFGGGGTAGELEKGWVCSSELKPTNNVSDQTT
jgi:hypothetical protein